MDSNWIDYKCKSGQTMFLYNKVTGEHKWPPGYASGDSSMHGEPVRYKETRSIAIQTDDYGCSNGCTSMYINTNQQIQLQSQQHKITDTGTSPRSQQLKRQQEPHFQPQAQEQPRRRLHQPNITETLLLREQQQQEPHQKLQQEHQLHPEPQQYRQQQFQLKHQPNPHLQQIQRCASDENDTGNECDEDNEWNDVKDQELAQDMEEISTMLEILEQKQLSSQNEENNKANVTTTADVSAKHYPEDPYICPHGGCDMKFVDDESLIVHLRSHREEKGTACGYCGKVFQSIYHLSVHQIRVHESENNTYECPTCKKTFSRKSNFNRHLKIHTGIKPYQCPTCKREFLRKETLQKHINSRTTSCQATSS